MSDFLDKGLRYLGNNKKNTFLINVGAMDGYRYDELIGYTELFNFKGLYVEPIPYLFERLKNNFKNKDGNLFENVAISDFEGNIEMMMIEQSAIDDGYVNPCFYGMSAVYPPKNGLSSEGDREIVEKYGKIVTVPTITLETLLKKNNIENFDILKMDAEGHDFTIFKQIDFEKYKPSIVRLEWVNLSEDEKIQVKNTFEKFGYNYDISGQDITGLSPELYKNIEHLVLEEKRQEELLKQNLESDKVTLVTGLWDIKRGDLTHNWSRTFDHYIEKFKQLLMTPNNMIIFGDENLEEIVWSVRRKENTQFIVRSKEWFINDFYESIQKIRLNPNWFNQSSWLPESTQAKLEMYNPLVMSKMFLLHDAKILDAFNSDYLFWIDAGLTNTVHPGYFTHDKVISKLPHHIKKFTFICFPYKADNEIHGFEFKKINQYAGDNVNLVARGGFFGGPKSTISDINTIYYGLLRDTLGEGYMGTEESVFSIINYRNADLVDYFEIEENGLISKFFEDLKNNTLVRKNTKNFQKKSEDLLEENTALYVITFNSPNQFETLIKSMLIYDEDFIKKPKKFLLDNSSNLKTTEKYKELCDLHGFEHIKKDNLGICGGRQFIAEHADQNNFDFYMFFEDDMFFYNGKDEVCKNGFNRHVKNLYNNVIQIVKKNDYDFLKFSYTEFFGDNGTQWSWYNVPQHIREEYFPEKPKLPQTGQDPNAPRTKFNNIKVHNGIPYVDGEVYYSNWPQIVSKYGNKKMFLTEKWAHPFEQTWMSYMFQETKKGNLNPALLLLTPTEHDRFEHYERGLRKES